jgi:hypothetical protein
MCLVCVLAVVWVLASCGSGGSSTTDKTVTSASGSAGAQASSAQPPPCRAADLQLRQSVGAGLGTTYLRVTLHSGSAHGCVLRRTLRARLLGPSGTPLLRSGENPSTVHTVVVGPDRDALLTIGWGNWCRNASGPFRSQLLLPAGGGRLLTRPWGPASCDGGTPPTLFLSSLRLGGGRK